MLNDFDINNIRDMDDARDCILMFFNLVETLKQENLKLKKEVQQLRDEINRLKGEQGKPKIKPNKKGPNQYSPEKERKERKTEPKEPR